MQRVQIERQELGSADRPVDAQRDTAGRDSVHGLTLPPVPCEQDLHSGPQDCTRVLREVRSSPGSPRSIRLCLGLRKQYPSPSCRRGSRSPGQEPFRQHLESGDVGRQRSSRRVRLWCHSIRNSDNCISSFSLDRSAHNQPTSINGATGGVVARCLGHPARNINLPCDRSLGGEEVRGQKETGDGLVLAGVRGGLGREPPSSQHSRGSSHPCFRRRLRCRIPACAPNPTSSQRLLAPLRINPDSPLHLEGAVFWRSRQGACRDHIRG